MECLLGLIWPIITFIYSIALSSAFVPYSLIKNNAISRKQGLVSNSYRIQNQVRNGLGESIFLVGNRKKIKNDQSSSVVLQSRKQSSLDDIVDLVYVEMVGAVGLDNEELEAVLSAVKGACAEFDVHLHDESFHHNASPAKPKAFPGTTGRVLLLSIQNVGSDWTNDDERLSPLQYLISEYLDELRFPSDSKSGAPIISQPILVVVRPNYSAGDLNDYSIVSFMQNIINDEVIRYQLCLPMGKQHNYFDNVKNVESADKKGSIIPSNHLEIDGAMIMDPAAQEEFWDSSTVLVLDDFIDEDHRKRLLNVVLGKVPTTTEIFDEWDDEIYGPNPERWVRGGLYDIPNDQSGNEDGPCWGLSNEAIVDICCQEHASISEFETKLCELFPAFTVTRLPEAVLGESVSPLTANAPTYGDTFDYHIDADPNLAPPSPWTDIYGRYPNRLSGKPRFMSCLLYLNEHWEEKFGAPTRFYDPPTGETFDVIPKPGRCVIMDQDIRHTVVPPSQLAGKRPRYSLVWKLILHPKTEGQNMKELFGDQLSRGDVSFVGSAKSDNHNSN